MTARPHLAVWRVWLALGTVYVIWGSTYLAIAIVVETLPPFLSAAARFLVAGGLLAAFLAVRGGPARLRVTRSQLQGTALVGLALLLFGNGFVQYAERDVPSGLAALIVGSVPLWVVIYRKLGGERIGMVPLAGVLLGFAGVAVLVLPRGASGEVAPIGFVFMLVATVSWAWGTFVSKRLELPRQPLVSTTLQQVFGGVGLLAAGLLVGEWRDLDPATFSQRSLLALAYLVVAGSLVAFSAYTWLLANVPVSQVATYAYVNPIVAVVLGALVLDERITAGVVVGAAMVITAVAFIIRQPAPPAPEAIELPEREGVA